MNKSIDRLMEAVVLADPADPESVRQVRDCLRAALQAAPSGTLADRLAALARLIDQQTLPWSEIRRALLDLQSAGGSGDSTLPEDAPSTVPGSPAALSWPREFDAELLSGFIVEAREHLDAADVHLLALEHDASDAEALHTVFRAFHTIKGAAGCLDLMVLQALAHETETLLDLLRHDRFDLGSAMDVLFDAVDAMKRLTDQAQSYLNTGVMPASDPELEALLGRIRRTAAPEQTDPRAGQASVSPIPSPAGPDVDPPSSVTTSEPRALKEHVRVDAERLDRLVDLIGELVIAESMVSQSAELRGLAAGGALGKSVGQLDKITRELQEMGMSLRMIPVRPLFQKMARLARDLSRKLGKPIEFAMSGEEIEIDKAIITCVADALVHIVRNALDHGIEETSEERLRAGKPAVGRIELRAFHREGSIVIEVRDDGRGLDPAAIVARAVEKGIVRKGETLSEQEIFKLVFLPGFSTAKVVTELSGRGVGLDVVRSSVESLRGRIEVQSRLGHGTTLRLRLPLTLAIIDGMVIRCGGERYIVPTLSITRLVRPEPEQRTVVLDRGEMLSIEDELIPMFRLNRMLGSTGREEEGRGVAVVIEEGGVRAAVLADEVLGQQQVVIKNLGMDLERVRGISGAVILPDGQVGLILDVSGLLGRSAATFDGSGAGVR